MHEQPTEDLLSYYFDKLREIPKLTYKPEKLNRALQDAQRAETILKERGVELK